MKISYSKWKDILNERLLNFNQKILVKEYLRDRIIFANDIELNDKNSKKYKRRIINKKTDAWVKNSDGLLSGTISESEVKASICSVGGIMCQKKYGEKIRQNLNIGIPWNKGLKGLKGTPHTEETKLKIGQKNKGENNGMYGKEIPMEKRQQISTYMKKLILDGKFTPNSNNRNTHWDSYYKGKKYRSSWEALYQYFDEAAEYEQLRIMYKFNNIEQVYIVDFVNHITKTCIEVKPKELCDGDKFKAKLEALKEWAADKQYSYMLVTKEWFKNQQVQIVLDDFDSNTQQKIKNLLK